MRPIRIATRGSALALAQAELVARRIVDLGAATSLVPVETSGDTDRQTPVAGLTEMGAFVRAVQRAVLEDRADLAVHSLKDLPLDGPGGLALQAVPERGSPNDALAGASLEELDEGAVVATGSPRRSAQLRWIRPDLRTIELRGNVDTRLRRLAQGEADAVVLARAGLDRLGHQGLVAQTFSAMEMTPAPGQGALAVEAVPGTPGAEIGAALDDPDLHMLVGAERSLLAETGAGCRSALGALAARDDDRITMTVFVSDGRGPRRAQVSGGSAAEVVAAARKELGL